MANSTRYNVINEPTMSAYFELINAIYCIRDVYAVEDMSKSTWPNDTIHMEGSIGSYEMKFDLAYPSRSFF